MAGGHCHDTGNYIVTVMVYVMTWWLYAGGDMVGLTPRHTYNASLGLVLRALAHMRAGGALLHAAEWRKYSRALHSDCICQRMSVVASVSGDSEEVCCPSLCPGAPCTYLSASYLLSVCLTTSSDSSALSVCLSVYLSVGLTGAPLLPCMSV